MDKVLRFFTDFAPLVYMVLGLVGLLTLRRLLRIWREWREAVFGLEREMAQQHLNRTLVTALMIILLALSELVLVSFLASRLPSAALLLTPTLDLLATPTGTLSPEMVASTPEAISSPTASTSGCIPDQLMLTSPKPGQVVSGRITLVGTVDIPNFGFYKYEVAPMGSDNWSTISAGREVKRDADLGFWDTTILTPGDYLLRLVALDNQNNALPPCIVQVRVTGQ